MNYRILPPEGWLEATVTLPLSKSMSARALVINSMAGAAPDIDGMADCDDTRAIAEGLGHGLSGLIDVGAAGTAMRFLTAYYASRPGAEVTLTGDERMCRRPIGLLVDALREVGAKIEYAGEEGFPPINIKGCRLRGGSVEMDGSVSSQFASAMMMVAPYMEQGLRITLRGEIVSLPYITMTLGMMEKAGVKGEFYGGDTVEIVPGTYRPCKFTIEGDWSAAAPWYEIEALSSGEVVISNITSRSLQGDSALAGLFHKMGVITDFEPEDAEGTLLTVHPDPDARLDMDFSATPDIVPSVAVTCCLLGIPFRFTGLATLVIKECDRISAIMAEMQKIGVEITREAPGVISWDGRRHPVFELPRFVTYGDHRMAMALAPVSVFVPGIVIEDAGVVTKSYPGFWDDLVAAGFTLLDGDEPMEAGDESDEEDVR